MEKKQFTDVANELREETDLIDLHSSTWRAISEILKATKKRCYDGLSNTKSGREEDLVYKGQLALIRKLENLDPRNQDK